MRSTTRKQLSSGSIGNEFQVVRKLLSEKALAALAVQFVGAVDAVIAGRRSSQRQHDFFVSLAGDAAEQECRLGADRRGPVRPRKAANQEGQGCEFCVHAGEASLTELTSGHGYTLALN